ncbi:hypothetical protein KXD93_06515 [Mucilaginibacter sp. BJC16-A38]|uniref:hypothetical protein n=1 Tax=Mucilaginibacter phenanthrenivorans TaxID=1234842 RepID=UPI00215727A4|nr:hypothetical protein [Mucilaginibacter phenanthrenivorans]MCR8557285.1 hypothetical protein [Mucilaginibacter phenanthrenivorans]
MKTSKSKKLNKNIDTICHFNSANSQNYFGETDPPTGTDPTNTTITVLTTATHLAPQKLTA